MDRLKLTLIVTGISLGIVLGILVQPVISGDNIFNLTRKFQEVLSNASNNYVDEVDAPKLTETAIKAMLAELDPHSIYLPQKQKEKSDEDFRGYFFGIGIEFDILHDTITVITPIVNGPSEKLGILAGDKIVKIDDQNAIAISQEDVPKKLKGPKGTQVKVHIKRAGMEDLLEFKITRDEIPIYSIDAAFMIDGTDIGYIWVNRFAATTHKEMLEAARKLKEQGMKRIILDLRGNPGGYLDQAFKMVDEFVKGGKKIVYTKARKSEFDEEYFSTNEGELENLPLIVMIDRGSASASEIVSGAIQDLDRGIIVGETSFGKGLVQREFPLSDGSAYRLTIARYFTPSGRLIQRPYKDKDKYYQLVGRAELEEGDNISHNEEKDTSRPSFKTSGGRTVIGGGGIVPDYVVKADTLAQLRAKMSIELFQKNAMREFIDGYISMHVKELREKYDKNFNDYLHNFEISNAIIAELRKVAEKKEIKWNEEQFKSDEKALKLTIKAQIARAIWNKGQQVQVTLEADRQVQKAMKLFPEASKIAKLN